MASAITLPTGAEELQEANSPSAAALIWGEDTVPVGMIKAIDRFDISSNGYTTASPVSTTSAETC
ncbi:hypothetical protein [Streptomyces bauhiniae]|uniref:hypothetical protein n=1 Tax=Streptomyces bauhiniae TaxID=2340725 RepID=UPI0035DD4923